MRSRYSAFALSLETYLLATWHPSTCPATLELDQAPQPQWLKLTVKRYKKIDAHHAMVEFVARYRVEGQVFTLKENSHFVWEAQKWWYVNGEIG
jgi:SEC-C motif-containing protein